MRGRFLLRALGLGGLLCVLSLGAPRGAEGDEPDDPFAGFQPAPPVADAPGPDADLFQRAVALQDEGRYRAARRLFWELIETWPDSPYTPEAADRSDPNAFLRVVPMGEHGPASTQIDVAVMGDGYLLDRQSRFEKDAEGHVAVLLDEPVFAAYASYFDFWRFHLASQDTGVDEVEPVESDDELEEHMRRRRRPPRTYETALDCKASGPQGQVAANPTCVFHYLSYLPDNDQLALCFARKGVLGTGGGGIATTAPRGVVVHEFGHAFAGLLDEYAIHAGEPFGFVESANTTTNHERPPWQHFLDARVPGVGIYEGGATFKQGVYRPAASCAMNTGGSRFCPVCREAVVLAIYRYASPIVEARPAAGEVPVAPRTQPDFEIGVRQPATHDLEVTWVLGPAGEATASASPARTPQDEFEDEMLSEEERRIFERIRRRGGAEVPATAAEPAVQTGATRGAWRGLGTGRDDPPAGKALKDRKGRRGGRVRLHQPVLPPLEPGRWQLVAVVRDPAKPRGERLPWVLKDDQGLLEDRLVWILVVGESVPSR